ncbi:MAG: YacP-like domain [Planctomycetota bacterium]|jgi:predicted RNA-binding protein with PIN domain
MRLLVDACNVLHVTGVLPPHLAAGEPWDLAELVRRSRYGAAEVTLVCDGSRPGLQRVDPSGGVALQWTGSTKADAAIEQTLRSSSHARTFTVVSNDRAVQACARRHGAEVLDAEQFLTHLAQDADRIPREPSLRRNVTLDAAATERWMRELGLDKDQS